MKIAVYYYIRFSGAKRVVMEHVKGLKLLGNTVDLYTIDNTNDIFDPRPFADSIYIYDFTPIELRLPFLKRVKKDYFDTFISLRMLHKKIARDIDSKQYDIVLVHTDINTQAPYLLRYLKTINAYFCLEPLRNAYEFSLRLKDDVSVLNKLYEDSNRWIRKRIDRKNSLCAKHTLTFSLFNRERMIAAYDLYPRISYLGIDEKTFRPKKLKKKAQVLFVADKFPIYGYDLALKAVNLIPKQNRPMLKVVSWKRNNSERISDEELVNLYNQSLVTLSLSTFDSFGLVPLESMACGVPVIALNVAGYRETILNGKTGYLTDFDPKEIAEKILLFMNHPEIAYQFGEKGRNWIESEWTWSKRIKELNSILTEFVKK